MDISLFKLFVKMTALVLALGILVILYLKSRNADIWPTTIVLSIMFGILTVFGLVMVGLYDVKKTVVEEHESSITVDDILYNEKDKKVYINKIDDKTEVIDSEKFFENVTIVYDKESAKVVKKSYKLWFITSDEYYVSITKDMYKDIVEW